MDYKDRYLNALRRLRRNEPLAHNACKAGGPLHIRTAEAQGVSMDTLAEWRREAGLEGPRDRVIS